MAVCNVLCIVCLSCNIEEVAVCISINNGVKLQILETIQAVSAVPMFYVLMVEAIILVVVLV